MLNQSHCAHRHAGVAHTAIHIPKGGDDMSPSLDSEIKHAGKVFIRETHHVNENNTHNNPNSMVNIIYTINNTIYMNPVITSYPSTGVATEGAL